MGSDALLVNTGRSGIVDEAALVDVLRIGELAGAALDGYEEEPESPPGLRHLRNTVLLRHLGSAATETRAAMAMLPARNVLAPRATYLTLIAWQTNTELERTVRDTAQSLVQSHWVKPPAERLHRVS